MKKKTEKKVKEAVKACCEEDWSSKKKCKDWKCGDGCGGCAYFLGVIGAIFYYVSTSTGFWNGVWGVIKALIWPAFLVFDVLKFIGA